MCGIEVREFGGDEEFPPLRALSPSGGGDAAKGSAPWRFPGALPLWGITHRRLRAARRKGAHGGREVLGGEGLLGGSCFNFDPAAAGGKPPPPRPSWVPRRSALRRASPRLPL